MRPTSIVNFERTVLASLVVGVVHFLLNREEAAQQLADAGVGSGFLLGAYIAGIVLYLLLLYFIARKASPVAKWIYVVLAVIGLVGGLAQPDKLLSGDAVSVLLTIAGWALSILSLWFLFRPDAKAWFSEGRGEVS